ncbi:MAG: L,D-transpeptidase [Thiotrichales bacterium]|nr:L,D-transpeptidase [Thiotrichales bacterium]
MTGTHHIEVSIPDQTLNLVDNDNVIQAYRVSTARNGAGELQDSECTPTGEHVISEKIGDGEPVNSVFVGRVPTGEIYTSGLRRQFPDRDWILTRILWLSGCEPGRNQGGRVDSRDRYIYIHGAPDDVEMGIPGSRGCIRMRNHDVIELFDKVDIATRVVIRN